MSEAAVQQLTEVKEQIEGKFEAVIQGSVLRKWLDAVGQLQEEPALKIGYDGWSSKNVDVYHVIMSSVELSKDAFCAYHKEGMDEVIIDIPILKKLASAIKGNMTEIKLTIGHRPVTSRVFVKLEWETKGDKFSLIHLMPEKQKEEHQVKVPNIELPVKFIMNRSQLDDLFELWTKTKLLDEVEVICENGVIYFQQEGTNGDSKQIVHAEVKTGLEGKYSSRFKLEYWKQMVNGLKAIDKVEVNLSNNLPIMVTGEKDAMSVKFLIAPRIVNE